MVDSAVAAIDCGTNSTRLLIVDAAGMTIIREMRITRLGEGVDASGQLREDAIGRTVEVLSTFRKLMDEHGVASARVVATSAVRDATNGSEFLERVAEIIGVPAELLSGVEEGQLSYRGATAGLDHLRGSIVVVDIGGGSTELVTKQAEDVEAISLNLGCVRVSERYLHSDPPLRVELQGATEAINQELEFAMDVMPALVKLGELKHMVGLAGTVATLAALNLNLLTYQRDQIHHASLTLQEVARWCDVLAEESNAARALRPGMLDGRQDVIVGGALVLREVMMHLKFTECVVSESDILDGLVASQR